MKSHAGAGHLSRDAGLTVAGAGAAAAQRVAPRRGRQTPVLAFCLLLALFGLESAIHSVHHLWDPQSAASCAFSSASQHAPGTAAVAADAGIHTWAAEAWPAPDPDRASPFQAARPHEGRAPPAFSSV